MRISEFFLILCWFLAGDDAEGFNAPAFPTADRCRQGNDATNIILEMKTNVQQILIFDEIFEEEALPIHEYLKSFNKKSLIDFSTHFLSYTHTSGNYSDNKKFIEEFFSYENSEIADNILLKIQKLSRINSGERVIINRESSLNLFEIILSIPDTDIPLSTKDFEINMFKAYLVSNQIIVRKQDKLYAYTETLSEEERVPAILLALSISNSDYVNYNLQRVLLSQIIKATIFLEFAESKIPYHFKKFLLNYHFSTWQEYIRHILPIIFTLLKSEKIGFKTIIYENNEDFEKLTSFIERFALQVDTFNKEENQDFKKIRECPIYILEKGNYRIILDIFLVEKLFKGLYFTFAAINDQIEDDNKISNFRSFICDNFSEKSILYSIMQRSFKNKYKHISGTEFKKLNISAEPDYYVRKTNKIFLFESKDILLNATIKASYDFEVLMSEINNKLHKAVVQLANNIERILKKELPDKDYKVKSLTIYPILLLHDRVYSTESLNYYLNK